MRKRSVRKRSVAVIFGGASPEYEISLASARAVLQSFPSENYEAIALGISRDGQWHSYRGPVEKIGADTWLGDPQCHPIVISPGGFFYEMYDNALNGDSLKAFRADLVMPLLHGINGEDGSVQGLIQLMGIPLVGCDIESSALCLDKYKAHIVAKAAGIEVPHDIVVLRDKRPSLYALYEAIKGFNYPLFVKPLRGGSSIGMSKLQEPSELSEALESAFAYDSIALIEEGVPGFEVGCAVIGNPNSERPVLVSRVDEIENPTGFFDFALKYQGDRLHTKIHLPARIDSETEALIRQTARKIYTALGCSGFARVDLFLTPAGRIVFNEVNTIPGFTESSRFPALAKTLGLDFQSLIECLLTEGIDHAAWRW